MASFHNFHEHDPKLAYFVYSSSSICRFSWYPIIMCILDHVDVLVVMLLSTL